MKEIERCCGHRPEWYVISKALNIYSSQRGISRSYPPLNDFLTYLGDQIEVGKRVREPTQTLWSSEHVALILVHM